VRGYGLELVGFLRKDWVLMKLKEKLCKRDVGNAVLKRTLATSDTSS